MATMVPMAASDLRPVWPMPDVWKSVPTKGGRRFGASRREGKRYHAGVDLLAPEGALVVAPEAGVLVAKYEFNGPRAFALLLQTDIGPVFNLAEVLPGSWREFGLHVGTRTKEGSWVDKGDSIARIGVNPGGSTMLHFEAYTEGTRSNQKWFPNKGAPRRLLDPTNYLMEAAGGSTIPPDPDPTPAGRGLMITLAIGIPAAAGLVLLTRSKKRRKR